MGKLKNIRKNMMKSLTKRSATTELQILTETINQILPDGYTRLVDNPDVRIAVDKIADLVSNMTIHLIQNTEKGDKRVKDGLSRKIDVNPCKYMTRKAWIYRIVQDLLLYGDGNAICQIKMNSKTGYVDDLIPLDMSTVSIHSSKNGYEIECGSIKYQPDEVVHFVMNPGNREYYKGTGYRIILKDLVTNLKQATATKNSFMSGKYMPSLVVKVDSESLELASEEGRDNVFNKYLKATEAGQPWIIPAELLEIEQIKPLSLKDIAINESVELDKKTVAGLLGVPAFFMGVGQFNKEEYNNFISTRVMSIANIIAQTLTRDILYSPDMYFKLNPRSLYSYNLTELVQAGGSMVQMNAMRRNELRDWVGLNPDEEMQELIVLENYVPQNKLGDQKKLVQDNETEMEGGE